MKYKKNLWLSVGLLAAFVLWTAAVRVVDVQAIGPQGSEVGFGALNGWFHELTGVHMGLYELTDALSVIPFVIVGGFGLLGLCQWVKRKKLTAVDFDILVLGGFYAVVLGAFLLFEVLVINYRPILIQGVLEASYPSSTTMLALCVMLTAMLQLKNRMGNPVLRSVVLLLGGGFCLFMVIGRLISGVHWLSDIIGGGLLSGGLVMLYVFFCGLQRK